jgi:CRISPR-associated protein Cas1
MYAAGLTGTVLSRRAQLLAYGTERGVRLASAYVQAKLENAENLLRYIGKYRKETQPDVYQELSLTAAEMRDAVAELERLSGTEIEAVRERMLSIEGRAAQRY